MSCIGTVVTVGPLLVQEVLRETRVWESWSCQFIHDCMIILSLRYKATCCYQVFGYRDPVFSYSACLVHVAEIGLRLLIPKILSTRSLEFLLDSMITRRVNQPGTIPNYHSLTYPPTHPPTLPPTHSFTYLPTQSHDTTLQLKKS